MPIVFAAAFCTRCHDARTGLCVFVTFVLINVLSAYGIWARMNG